MKNGYYIYAGLHDSNGIIAYPGVKKKIDDQMIVFKKYYDMELIELKETKGHKIRKRLPLAKSLYKYAQLEKIIINPFFVYIRMVSFDRGFLLFVKRLKQSYPECKIILEVFTYPYDKDRFYNKGIIYKDIPYYIKDVVYRNLIYKYVDRITIYANIEKLWKIKTIRIQNGVNVRDIKCKNRGDRVSNRCINMIAVATFQKQHGYERVLIGLGEYYKKGGDRAFHIYMVGDGPEIPYYKDIVRQYHIENNVSFTGVQQGEQLDLYFEKSDLALGVFGLYKNGIEGCSSLKTREYLSRGLPIISGCNEDILSGKKLDFFFEFENNSSVVNMESVISFYDNITKIPKLNEKIRHYAEDNVSIEKSLQPVIDYIEERVSKK